jgi:hypothetical protein
MQTGFETRTYKLEGSNRWLGLQCTEPSGQQQLYVQEASDKPFMTINGEQEAKYLVTRDLPCKRHICERMGGGVM